MDVVVERCAGLDVHRDSVVATVRLPGSGKSRRRREQQTRSFGTTIGSARDARRLAGGFGVTLVGMEATGVYWKPVFYVLEPRFECWLLNAQHLHNVPGRKSDVIDSAWCCRLVEHGLVRPSFVPPPEIRRLRDLTRLCVAKARSARARSSAGEGAPGRRDQALERRLDQLLGLGAGDARRRCSRCQRPGQLAELAKARLRAKIPSCRRRSPTASSSPTTACSSRACSPTSTRSTRRSPRSTPASQRPPNPRRADRAALHDPRRQTSTRPGC
jgi:transposase